MHKTSTKNRKNRVSDKMPKKYLDNQKKCLGENTEIVQNNQKRLLKIVQK